MTVYQDVNDQEFYWCDGDILLTLLDQSMLLRIYHLFARFGNRLPVSFIFTT